MPERRRAEKGRPIPRLLSVRNLPARPYMVRGLRNREISGDPMRYPPSVWGVSFFISYTGSSSQLPYVLLMIPPLKILQSMCEYPCHALISSYTGRKGCQRKQDCPSKQKTHWSSRDKAQVLFFSCFKISLVRRDIYYSVIFLIDIQFGFHRPV